MERNLRKTKTGVVVSNKMDKSISVKVEALHRHPIYGKFIKKSKKIHRTRRDQSVRAW